MSRAPRRITDPREFGRVATTLRRRIELFISLPFAKLDRLMLQRSVMDIGRQ